MVRRGKELVHNTGSLPVLGLAVMADHAVQQFVLVLKAAIEEEGFFPVIHEADYGTAAFEAFDGNSGLYASGTGTVYFSMAMQKYRARFYEAADAPAREALPQAFLDEVLAIVGAMAEKGLKVIVSNLALPLERMFGNYALMTAQSLWCSVLRFNQLLARAAADGLFRVNDVMYLGSRFGAEAFLDERLWQHSKYLCANRFLPDLARQLARTLAVQQGRVSKCLVLDLDNTLWGGVIGDDGLDGIVLGGNAEGEAYLLFQRYLLALKQRGYILTVCSKNNEETALDVFRRHPEMLIREEDVAVFVANWNDKAANIEYIARVLNIGLESLIFIDDSAFERNQVRQALPMVRVPELPEDVAGYMAVLESSGLLEATGFSDADAVRSQMYREEAKRSSQQLRYGNIDDYLRSLQMVIELRPFQDADMGRVAQLFQRSNQFNLRTQRLDERQCRAFRDDTVQCVTLQARLQDCFGDYGLICAIACNTVDGWLNVAELAMSCRVLKRGVESYLITQLFEHSRRMGLRGLRGEYIPTAKNAMVRDFYRQFGFDPAPPSDAGDVWLLPVERYVAQPTFISPVNT
jgi:FkbH-like protein